MTIVAATLPHTEAGATLNEGETFVVRGSGFFNWPDEVVLGFNSSYVTDFDDLSETLVVVGRTSDSITFRVRKTYTYDWALDWQFFGTPLAAPRTLLEYDTV